MKRSLFFAALAVIAIGSYGGHTIGTAHAQTAQALTPSQTAAMEQELAVAKATLVNLEQQAGMVPTGDSGTTMVTPAPATAPSAAATGLTASEVSAFQSTLNTLAATLMQLNTSLAVNANLTSAQTQAVQATLNGMQNTLVAMAGSITGKSNTSVASAPVAAAQSARSPVAVNVSPSAPTAPSLSASAVVAPTAANTPVAAAPSTNVAPQTAQASSFWSFTKAHWPTIVIVLLVIAILAILFWPEKETVKTVSTGNSGSGKPKSAPTPITTATMPQSSAPASAKMMADNNGLHTPATPMSNAVAAPSQK